jgi:hypothetical protein
MSLTKEELDLINKNVTKKMERAEQYQRIQLLLRNMKLYVEETRHKLLCPEEYDFKQLEEISYTGEALESISDSLDELPHMLFMLVYSFDPIVAKHFSTTKAEEAKDAIL